MSRSTQYIGLNRWAKEYVKQAYKEEIIFVCNGMFDKVYGKKYYIQNPDGTTDVLQEVLQDSPWSSGPMIFTCLHYSFIKKDSDNEIDLDHELFQWMLDPSLKDIEFDYDSGRYWV